MAIVFDEQLRNRLLAFQKAHGLAEDGVVGAKTWTKIAQLAGTADTDQSKGTSDSAVPGGDATATEGDAGAGGADTAPIDGHGPAITAANFPLLFQIAEKCRDEEGVKEFLRAEADIDLDEILGNIEAVLGADTASGLDGEK